MGTYVMTDIHGCYDAMKKMLDKIGFSASDRMIFAGDYIDRGPQSYEMLRWIENPDENITLLRGNHDENFSENMELMGTLFQQKGLDPDSLKDTVSIYGMAGRMLSFFDYYKTIGHLIGAKRVPFRQLSLWAACIQKMPYFYQLMLNGRRCIIVHAGYIENLENTEIRKYYSSLRAFYLGARDDAYIYGGVEHGMIIAGHTPTVAVSCPTYNQGNVYRHYDVKKDCIFYDLDCGYVFQGIHPEAKLACLRLEDEEIFYIE